MSLFRGLGRMSLSYLIMMLRSKLALFWTLAFPLFFLIGFGYIFGGNDPQRVAFIVPGVLTITIISATFFGASMNMVAQRENGVFRRYRVTPVSPVVVVAAHAIMLMINLLFRWESDEPLNLRRLGMAVGGLTLVYLIAAFAIPSFKMTEQPGFQNTPAINGETAEVRVLKGMTVLDGLGGRLENARVTIRGQKIAAVENGDMRAPRVFFSGPSITAPGGHPAAMFQFVPGLAETLTRQITTAEQARAAVTELAEYKVDLLKLILEEGFAGRPLPLLAETAFREAVKTAKALGLRTTCHVDSDKNARLAIDAGIDVFEHIPGDLSEQTIKMLVEKGISLTPTLSVYKGYQIAAAGDKISDDLILEWVDENVIATLYSPSSWLAGARQNAGFAKGMRLVFEKGMAATKRAIAGGMQIIAGSDAGNPATFHGPGLFRELELLVEAGMAPEQALIASTSRPADRLGRKDLGRIAEGAYADMVVLAADPTKDMRAFRQVKAVYLSGKMLDRETLLTSSPGTWQPGR